MRRISAIVCDLDGTLADYGNRSPYDGHLCRDDRVNQPVVAVIDAMHQDGYAVIILTGRSDEGREATQMWLGKHEIPYDALYMRDPSDWRPSADYKLDVYEHQLARHYAIQFMLEDDPNVAKAFRQHGVPVFLVDEFRPYEEKHSR